MFIRVRGAKPGDPLHEFDIPEARFKQRPDLFTVVKGVEPSTVCRPPTYKPGTVRAKRKPTKKEQA